MCVSLCVCVCIWGGGGKGHLCVLKQYNITNTVHVLMLEETCGDRCLHCHFYIRDLVPKGVQEKRTEVPENKVNRM